MRLRALLASQRKDMIMALVLEASAWEGLPCPHGAKYKLINALVEIVKRDIKDMYRLVLKHFTKTVIDVMLPRKGKKKDDSMDLLFALDHPTYGAAPTVDPTAASVLDPNALADVSTCSGIIVPLIAEDTHCIVPLVRKTRNRLWNI